MLSASLAPSVLFSFASCFAVAARTLTMSTDEYCSDSSDGVEEESAPISLQYKKSKLFEKTSSEPQVKQNTPGKLKSWQPLSNR